MIDYYKILGLDDKATTSEIKQAYRELALKYHPDRNNGDEKSEAYFKRVTEAYNVLSDPESRENYNRKFKASNRPPSENREQPYTYKRKAKPDRTPETVLEQFITIKAVVISTSNSNIDQPALFNALDDLLTVNTINFLLSWGDIESNKQIVQEVLICCKRLTHEQVVKLAPKLVRLAGTDNNLLMQIYLIEKDRKLKGYWSKYKGIAIVGIIAAVIIALNLNNSSNDSTYDNPTNGDLNGTFINKESNNTPNFTPELTEEEKLKAEKEKLAIEGWEETELNNGQFPSCYNFTPKKSSIDNYLEVVVGGGTDIALKLMNVKTEKCIRYVFINSGTTYAIRNIPEGKYYLKIAYGKEWFSKIENDQCIGKFVRNPMYEKGEEVLDFNLQYNSDGYRIPSYTLQLDMISTNSLNSFDSHDISESEFNK